MGMRREIPNVGNPVDPEKHRGRMKKDYVMKDTLTMARHCIHHFVINDMFIS